MPTPHHKGPRAPRTAPGVPGGGGSDYVPFPFSPVFPSCCVLRSRSSPAGTLPLIGPSTRNTAGHCPEPLALIGPGHLAGTAYCDLSHCRYCELTDFYVLPCF